MIQHIRKSRELPSIKDHVIKLYEDNATYITQIKGRFIKMIELSISFPNFSMLTSFRKMMTIRPII